jgi:hypothetical protein
MPAKKRKHSNADAKHEKAGAKASTASAAAAAAPAAAGGWAPLRATPVSINTINPIRAIVDKVSALLPAPCCSLPPLACFESEP